MRWTSAVVSVLALAGAVVLAGCTDSPPYPLPTKGAAWGDFVVPLDADFLIEGGVMTEPGGERLDEITIDAGVEFVFEADNSNGTGEKQGDVQFRIWHSGPVRLDDRAMILTVDGESRTLDDVEIAAIKKDPGLLVGELERAGSASLRYTAVPKVECGTGTIIFYFRVFDASGDRNQIDQRITVVADACPTDSSEG